MLLNCLNAGESVFLFKPYTFQMILSVAVFQDFDPKVNIPLRILYKPVHAVIGIALLVSTGYAY